MLHARETRPASVHWLPLILLGHGRTPQYLSSVIWPSRSCRNAPASRPVWKQIETRLFIPFDPDTAAAYQMIDPMGFDAPLWQSEESSRNPHPSWARPPVAMQSAVPKANQLTCWRATPGAETSESLRGQYLRNLLIRFPWLSRRKICASSWRKSLKSTRRPTVHGTASSLTAPPRQTIRVAIVSGARRSRTTLSIRTAAGLAWHD